MEETRTLREWAPLTEIINLIPVKTQMGLFSKYISITAIDAVPEFIAFGTNVGAFFWYNRKLNQMDRFKCQSNTEITCVRIVSTVDFMVACGHQDGQISIFQIPKLYPELLPDSLRSQCSIRKLECYTVTEIHQNSISSLEWTTNGMKLFSGDKNGLVVLTELDFSMHICKEVEIVNESYEIVQISYSNQYLLISTMYRSIICQRINGTWKVCQVGKKDRKNLGQFGGIFVKTGLKSSDLVAYCSRPGLRIWQADITGAVERTILFKDLIASEVPEIPLLNPISNNLKQFKDSNDLSFGRLLYFNNKFLVSYESDVVYILDCENLAVVGAISRIRRVLDVACNKEELFILEGERSLIRIAFEPEPIDSAQAVETNPPQATVFTPISSSIKDITSKLQATNILAATLFEADPITESSLDTINPEELSHAEEALESPTQPYSFNSKNYVDKIVTNSQQIAQIVANLITTNDPIQVDKNLYVSKFESPRHCVEKTDSEENLRKLDLYERIGEEDFDSILFKPAKRKPLKKVGNRMTSSCCYPSTAHTKLEPLNCSMIEAKIELLKPDLRSPDSIQNDIKSKELLLSDVLYYNKTVIEKNSDENMDENMGVKDERSEEEKMLANIPNTNGTFKIKLKKLEMPVWVEDEKPSISAQPSSSTNGVGFMKRIRKKTLRKDHGYAGTNLCDVYTSSFNPDDFLGIAPNYGITSNDLTDGSDVSLNDWEII